MFKFLKRKKDIKDKEDLKIKREILSLCRSVTGKKIDNGEDKKQRRRGITTKKKNNGK